jgi:hypothetical protein
MCFYFADQISCSPKFECFLPGWASILAAPKWTKRAWLAENGLSPKLAPLKFLKLAWQSEIASLGHEKFRSFRDFGTPGGHFLKAEGIDDRLFSSFGR